MCFHVFLAVDARFERLLTVWTHKGADLAVRRHVPLQAAICCKRAVTDQTFVGFQTCVCPDVGFQNSTGNKRPGALQALKWLFSLKKERKKRISDACIS